MARQKDPEDLVEQLKHRIETITDRLYKVQPTLANELREAHASLFAAISQRVQSPRHDRKYAGYRSAIMAIEAFLGDVGDFVERTDVVQALMEGGYAEHEERRSGYVYDAIRYHAENGRLQESDTKIGLPSFAKRSVSSKNRKK